MRGLLVFMVALLGVLAVRTMHRHKLITSVIVTIGVLIALNPTY